MLSSKFAVPAIHGPLVHRPRLLERLDAGTQGPLTLISASAGTGKSLLAAAWTESGRAPGSVAWLTLDAADDEPGRFWFYVLEALAHRGIDLARPRTPPTSGVDPSFLPGLAADLAELDRPVVLVLDEFDAVSDVQLCDGLEFVLRHAAGALRLVLLTRRDPVLRLHRYRVRGELLEIRAADLALTTNESARLLRSHGIALTHDALNALQQRTEGWVAGLRLAVLALAGRSDPDRFLAEFTADETTIADYLVGEVLNAQSAETRDLLLRTSLLDQVHPDLANALTGRTDARRTLAALEHDNAFVTAVDDTHDWYRYHRLLTDVLRVEIAYESPDLIPDLHLRAARWLASAGRLPEAVDHAAAAGDGWSAAALVVDGLAVGVLLVPPEGSHLAASLAPAPAAVDGPEPVVMAAALALAGRDLTGASTALHVADARATEAEPERQPALRLAIALLRAVLGRASGNAEGTLAAARQVHDLLLQLPGDVPREHPEIPALACAAEAAALSSLGRLGDAESALAAGLAAADGSQLRYPRLDLLGQLAALDAVRGRLRKATELAREVIEQFDDTGLPARHRISAAHLALAWSATEWNDLAVARHHLDLSTRGSGADEPAVRAWRAVVRARLARSGGDLTAALDALANARTIAGEPFALELSPWLECQLAAVAADVHVAQGDAEAALVTLKRATGADRQWAASAWARALLASGDAAAAGRVLRRILSRSGGHRQAAPVLAEAWLLRAQAAVLAGDGPAATRSIERAWRAARPEELRRPFLEEGPWLRRLLRTEPALVPVTRWLSRNGARAARASVPRPRRPDDDAQGPRLVEPLSARELEVLGHLAQMMTTDEIAAQLCVSRNTVKTHLRNLYRKLSAARRSDAVRRARQVGFL